MIQDGPNCPGCGFPNYSGLCPHCRGSQADYERELVPPFLSTLAPLASRVAEVLVATGQSDEFRAALSSCQDSAESLQLMRQYIEPLVDDPAGMTFNCDKPGCGEVGARQCEVCDGWFCSDHGTRGGDRETEGGLVAYPACCWKCGGFDADA